MDAVERARLREVMAGMAEGDMAMLVALVEEFGTPLRGVVRRTLFSFGRRDLLADPADVTDLVTTAALEVFDRAAAWQPDGAPPWVWAERAIRASLAAHVGHALADVSLEQLADQPVQLALSPGLDGDARRVLRRLAQVEPRAGLWWHAVGAITSDRNRRVYFEYELQKALGDRSPARTVGGMLGLRPANVRQIARRVRVRLADRIEHDARLAPLRDLRWFAA
jgi:hypothetical protein